jgi:hypothetical protein
MRVEPQQHAGTQGQWVAEAAADLLVDGDDVGHQVSAQVMSGQRRAHRVGSLAFQLAAVRRPEVDSGRRQPRRWRYQVVRAEELKSGL